jgi:MSHA biogenesis protein MshN
VSVINKMLRDLDSRQAPGPSMRYIQLPDTGSVDTRRGGKDRTVSPQGMRWLRVGGLLGAITLIGIAAAGWLLKQNKVLSDPVTPLAVVAPVMAPVAQLPKDPAKEAHAPSAKPLPAGGGMVFEIAPALESSTWAQSALKMDNSFKRELPPAPAAKPAPPGLPPPKQPERLPHERPAAMAAPSAVAAHAGPAAAARQVPAMDALAQAQSLWQAGSHEAAMDLLHDALASTERAHLAGLPAGNSALLATLVRELARMELAEGRVSQTLAMLTRLEPALSGVADVWAIRGNAAQRLGRHQESAAAYAMALKLRPEEPRWLLGAAVSLAAQGQTVAAAELAEKARAGGVLSAEVATYLRQLGVILRER